jgi:hypothetical protein
MSERTRYAQPAARPFGTRVIDPNTGRPIPGEFNQDGQPMGTPRPQPIAPPAAPNLTRMQAGGIAPNLSAFQASQPGAARPVATGQRTGMPTPVPVGGQAPAPIMPPGHRPGENVWLRGSTPQEIAAFRDRPNNAPNPAAVAAAGTGNVIQTPYGSGSSTMARPGQRATDAVVGPNGVSHLTWQQQVVRDHPEIGQAGTSANRQFVEAYGRSQQSGPQTPGEELQRDPRKIADNIYRKPSAPGVPETWADYAPPADIKAPAPIGGAVAPVMFAGSDVSGDQPWSKIPTPATGATAAGLATGSALQSSAAWADNNLVRPVLNGIDAVTNFAGGLLGAKGPVVTPYKPYQAPSDKAPSPAPATPDPIMPAAGGTWSGWKPPEPFAPKPLTMGDGDPFMTKPKKRATLMDNVGQGYGA